MDEAVSQFNMSLATLERINNLLKEVSYWNSSQNVVMIIRTINSLYKELNPFLLDAEKKKAKKSYEDIVCIPKNKLGKRLHACDEFETWIRDRLNAKGLLMSNKDYSGL